MLTNWGAWGDGTVVPEAPTANTTALNGNILRAYNDSTLNYDGTADVTVDRLYLNNNDKGADGSIVRFNQTGGTLTNNGWQLGRELAGANAAAAVYTITAGTITGGDIVFGSGTANKLIVDGGTVRTSGVRLNSGGYVNVEINDGVLKSTGQSGNGTTTGSAFNLKITDGAFETKELRFGGADTTGIITLTGGALRIGTTELGGNNSYLPHSGGTVNINLSNGAEFTVGSQIGTFGIAQDENSKAYLTLNGTSTFARNGTGAFTIGKGKNAVSELALNDTAGFSTQADLKFGNGEGAQISATFNDGATFNATKSDGRVVLLDGAGAATTTVSVNDSATFTVANQLVVGHYNNNNVSALATLNIGSDAAKSATVSAKTVVLGRYDSGNDSPVSLVNLNAGGTLAAEQILKGGGTATKTINGNGGAIRALADAAEFFGILQSGGAAAIVVNINEGGLTFDTNGKTVTTAQKFSGTGTLTKSGTGELYLNGAFDGAIVVAEGTLGGTLDAGAGTGVLADITVKSGATLAPGNSPGTLHAGDVVLESGAALVLEVSGATTAGTDYDQLVANSLTLASGSTVEIQFEPGIELDDIFTFFEIANITDNGANFTFTGLGAGLDIAFNPLTGEIVVVSEPGTYALLAGAVLLGGVVLRRRRQR